jgi:type IV pilus assembly protein PilM
MPMQITSEFFKKIFYPIHYLSMPAAGIDIGETSVKYLEFSSERGTFAVKNFGEMRLPSLVLQKGELINRDVLVKTLGDIREKISSKLVKACIPEEKTYIFEIKIPYVSFAEVRQAVEFRLEENVPFKADQVYFEWSLITEDKENDEMHLSVSVIPKDVIEMYLDIFHAAGLYPISFEVKSRMAAKSVVPHGTHKNYVVMHLKDESTTLSLVSSDTVLFTTTIPVGGNAIEEDMKKVGVSKKAKTGEYMDALANVFSIIKDELEKFITYVKSNPRGLGDVDAIEKIIVCGRYADMPGFLMDVGQNISGLDISLGNVWVNMFNLNTYLPPIPFRDSLKFAATIGLAAPYEWTLSPHQ